MSSFRLPSDVLVGWKDALAKERGSADDALQDILRALQGEAPDQHVVVTRHQLFSWAQAVEGAARKGRPQLQAVADDMRAYLGGPAPAARAGPVAQAAAPLPQATGYVPAPPIVYQKGPALAPGAAGATRLVTERELGGFVTEMLREAQREVLVVSPFGLGLESLAAALVALPPSVQVRALTRRPPQEGEEYHRTMQQLRKRGVDVVFSPHVQTRMMLTDGARLLLGAASVPGPQSRECAVATTEAALVAAARANFERLYAEAKG